MKRQLMRPLILAFLAIALISLPPATARETALYARVTSVEVHHRVSSAGQLGRRRRTRRGAIGAGGAGVYKAKAKRRSPKRGRIKKRPVWDDTDIVH